MAIAISHKINLLPKMISQKASLHIPSRGFQRGFLQIGKFDFDISLCFYDLTYSLLFSCQSSSIPTYVTHSITHSFTIMRSDNLQFPCVQPPTSSTSNFLMVIIVATVMVVMVVVVNMVVIVFRTGQDKLTFKLHFPGNL